MSLPPEPMECPHCGSDSQYTDWLGTCCGCGKPWESLEIQEARKKTSVDRMSAMFDSFDQFMAEKRP